MGVGLTGVGLTAPPWQADKSIVAGVELSRPVAATLERAYGVGQWLGCEPSRGMNTNASTLVRTESDTYVLRRSHPRKSREGMAFEVRLMEHLRAHGYHAPVLVRTREGAGYVEHDGAFYLMTRFIAGDAYAPADPRHLHAAGRAIGHYHRIVRRLPLPHYRRPAPRLTGLAAAAASFATVARVAGGLLPGDEQARFEQSLTRLRDDVIRVEAIMMAVYPTLQSLVIHGSFGPTALIFAGGEVVGVLDYDRATREVLSLDLAYTLRAFCRLGPTDDGGFWTGFDYARCRAFVAAYREVEPLPDVEVSAVPLVLQGHRLLMVLRKFDNFLAKHSLAPQGLKDARKLMFIAEREAVRVRWLEEHGDKLRAALAG